MERFAVLLSDLVVGGMRVPLNALIKIVKERRTSGQLFVVRATLMHGAGKHWRAAWGRILRDLDMQARRWCHCDRVQNFMRHQCCPPGTEDPNHPIANLLWVHLVEDFF